MPELLPNLDVKTSQNLHVDGCLHSKIALFFTPITP